jgi:hypothetical protein
MAQGRHSNGSCLSLFTFLVVCFYFLFQTTFFCVYRSFFRCLDYMSRDLVYFAAEIDINVFVYTPFSSFCIFEYAYYLHSTRLYSYGRKMRKIRKYGLSIISQIAAPTQQPNRSEVRKQHIQGLPLSIQRFPAGTAKASLDDIYESFPGVKACSEYQHSKDRRVIGFLIFGVRRRRADACVDLFRMSMVGRNIWFGGKGKDLNQCFIKVRLGIVIWSFGCGNNKCDNRILLLVRTSGRWFCHVGVLEYDLEIGILMLADRWFMRFGSDGQLEVVLARDVDRRCISLQHRL